MTARGKFNPAWLLAAFMVVVLGTSIGWMAYHYQNSRSDTIPAAGDTETRNTQVTPDVAALPERVAAQYAADGVELRNQLAAGRAAYAAGDYAGAVTALRAVIALSDYDSATQTAFFLLGNIYDDLGQYADAAFCQRQALRCGQLAEAWHNLALTELHRGNLDAALEAATQALRLDKEDRGYRALLAVVYEQRSEFTSAMARAQASVENDTRSALRLLNLALLTARAGNTTTAMKLLEQAGTAPAGAPATRRRVAEEHALLLLDSNRPAEAVTVLKQALASAPGDAVLQHNYGVALIRALRWPEAVTALRLAHAAAPAYAPTMYALSAAHRGAGSGPEAIAALQRGLELDPENTERYFQLAQLFSEHQEYESARRTLEQILAIGAPTSLKLPVQVELALLASRRGEHDNALALMRTAAALEPETPWVLFDRGVLAWLAGEKTAAYRDLDSALQKQPDNSVFAQTRADLLFRDRRYAEAITAYNRLLGISKTGNFGLHGYAQLGWLHQQQRKFSLAREEYNRALALQPGPALLYLLTLNLATVLAESGNQNAALEKLHAAITMFPNRFEAYHNAALISGALGRTSEAMAFIRVAERLAPTTAAVPLARGCLLWGKGLHAEAAAAWEQAAVLDPALIPARYNLEYYRRQSAPSATAAEVHR